MADGRALAWQTTGLLAMAVAAGACGSGSAGPQRSTTARGQESPAPPALDLTREIPRSLADACRELTEHPRTPAAAKVCPPLVPAGKTAVELSGPFSRQRRYRGGWTMSLASCSLTQLNGESIETNGCHWLYQVAWTKDVRRLVRAGVKAPPNAAHPSRCGEVQHERLRLTTCRVTSFERGGGMHAGHVAYLWRNGPVLHALSAHGYANEPRVRSMMAALADSVRSGG